MGDDPSSVDLYSDVDDITISKEPFLYGQVVDNTGQPIRWEGRAKLRGLSAEKPSEEPQQRAAYHLQRHH